MCRKRKRINTNMNKRNISGFGQFDKLFRQIIGESYEVDVEIGYGDIGSPGLDSPSVIDVGGIKYIVSGEVTVSGDVAYDEGDPETGLSPSASLGDDYEVYVNNFAIQSTTEMDPNGRDQKFLYEVSNGNVVKDELKNPQVVQAAIAALEKRANDDVYSNPEKYDPDSSDTYRYAP